MTAMHRVEARIERIRVLDCGVHLVDLTAGGDIAFEAGQYLQVITPEGPPIPFSIASAPAEWPRLTLHYLPQPGNDDARRMDGLLADGTRLTLSLPHGHCGQPGALGRSLLLLAGGSGIAQARSILRAWLPATVPVRLYWGAATATDLYLRDEFDALAGRHAEFRWTAITEAPAVATRQGRVDAIVAEDVETGTLRLADWDVLIAGSPPMVWATVATLKPLGLDPARTRSDVFDYAPRPDLWD